MRGGYRQNAGRKQGFAAKNAEEVRRILSDMVMREIEPIGKALIDKAKKGDVTATRELFDRAFGRAPQNAPIDSLNSNAAIPTPILSNLFVSPETIERHNLRTQAIYGGLSQQHDEDKRSG